jgi:nucleoside-diphosphate-sugar epimerase
MFKKHALIVGITGIVGMNVAEYLLAQGDWQITGVSRTPPTGINRIRGVALDVLDREATLSALSAVSPSHVYFCTWTRRENEDENIKHNSAMLTNVLDALAEAPVEHVAVVTGTKHYLGPFENYAKNDPITPFREEYPRLPIKNFYYALEDVVMGQAQTRGFSWSIHRSHTIIGYAVGNLMNIGATLAAHASICRETAQPFFFPGHPTQYTGITDITDARLLGRHIVWASTTDDARNEAFNVVNGDTFRWKRLWSVIANYFGILVADYPGQTSSLELQMKGKDAVWDSLIQKHGLQPVPLKRLASPWHTDLDLGRPMECVNAMGKSRKLGFLDYQDSEQSFIDVFDRLRRERIIP